MAAASPSQFFDPFFSRKQAIPSDGLTASPGHEKTEDGKLVAPRKPEFTNTLPVTGQGTVAVSSDARNLLSIAVETNLDGGPILHLDIGNSDFLFYFDTAAGKQEIPYVFVKSKDACYLDAGKPTTYWLSLDQDNGILRYGKYYTNKAMTLVEARLKRLNKDGLQVWDDPPKFSWLSNTKKIQIIQDESGTQITPIINPLPIVIDRSPFVLSADKVTLLDLEKGTYTAPVNLPEACQVLYGNVAGANIVLNDDDFPDFSDAIQRSCITEGCWAYNKLKEKQGEFGSDPNGTYLRITLGYNLGDSPGIPYVLEIWPSKHYSPIHDHGNACAVIKVLHGDINCTWYTSLSSPCVLGSANLKKGMVTWIGDENYQVHKLHNETPGVCATIQCYRYPDADNVHYDAFNWIDGQGEVKPFPPNSDLAFGEFRETMRREWEGASGGR
ncbi:hypothetical protein KVT40_002361 [Elsinoe batatas]|uniref:Cysteine dioxygenase n=1 Tax=Elsinoe batatas TaxID=2601811 RepID=A0A8K0L7Q0_9PEZI|nr:hypothetical protein KVT40_002361 [Elsinoe batatas]